MKVLKVLVLLMNYSRSQDSQQHIYFSCHKSRPEDMLTKAQVEDSYELPGLLVLEK